MVTTGIGVHMLATDAVAVKGIGQGSNRITYAAGRRERVETEIIVTILFVFVVGIAEYLHGVFF